MFTSRSCVIMLYFSLLFMFLLKNSYGYPQSVETQYTNCSLDNVLDKFQKGNYSFEVGQAIEGYHRYKENYKVHLIDSYENCLGITTDANETIVLECPEKKTEKQGCFEIFTPESKPLNNSVVPTKEITRSCIRCVAPRCVGVITPKGWMIIFKCLPRAIAVPHALFDVPPNEPPRM